MNPSSRVARILLGPKFVRYLGKKIIKVYALRVPGGVIYVRSAGSDRPVVKEIFLENIYEKFYSLKPSDIVVDVGANIGAFAIKAAFEVAPAGHVFAVEPASSNFRLLERNIEINSLEDSCTAMHCAFGSSTSTGRLHIYTRGASNSLVNRELEGTLKSLGTEDVQIDTLDNVLFNKLTRLDFLKVDVEGFELEVLKGAEKTLSKFHPKIALEKHSFGPPMRELALFLSTTFGYTLESMDSGSGHGMVYCK